MASLLNLKPLTAELLPEVVELDRKCFGGLWTLEGYQRELDSRNSDILLLIAQREPGSRGAGGAGGALVQGCSCAGVLLSMDSQESPVKSPQSRVPSSQSPILAMGCLWAILDEAHITIVAVHPRYQRQGLGQAILIALLSRARQRGLERATLEVKASNLAAISLYQKFGFQVAGRRRGYYQDTGEDALILWMSGLQNPQFQQTWADWERMVLSRLASFGWYLHSLAITD